MCVGVRGTIELADERSLCVGRSCINTQEPSRATQTAAEAPAVPSPFSAPVFCFKILLFIWKYFLVYCKITCLPSLCFPVGNGNVRKAWITDRMDLGIYFYLCIGSYG